MGCLVWLSSCNTSFDARKSPGCQNRRVFEVFSYRFYMLRVWNIVLSYHLHLAQIYGKCSYSPWNILGWDKNPVTKTISLSLFWGIFTRSDACILDIRQLAHWRNWRFTWTRQNHHPGGNLGGYVQLIEKYDIYIYIHQSKWLPPSCRGITKDSKCPHDISTWYPVICLMKSSRWMVLISMSNLFSLLNPKSWLQGVNWLGQGNPWNQPLGPLHLFCAWVIPALTFQSTSSHKGPLDKYCPYHLGRCAQCWISWHGDLVSHVKRSYIQVSVASTGATSPRSLYMFRWV